MPAQAEVQNGGMCSAGFSTPKPILPATGEKLYTHTDYTDTGSHPLSLTRSYRSRWSVIGAAGFAANPGLGQAWAHNHSSSLSIQTNTGASGNSLVEITSIRLTEGSGSIRVFEPVAGSTQFKDSSGPSTLTTGAAGSNGLPTTYTLNLSDDDSQWQFDAAGKLLTKTERNGWTTTYSYIASGNGVGQLGSVTNAFGRSINFAYNAAGQLVSANMPDGQVISYTFDSSSRMIGVRYHDNSSKSYVYEDSRWPQSVTGIIDERGMRLATVVYDAQGRAVESGYAGGADYYKVSYPATSNLTSAQITDPLGTTRTYNYGTTLGKLTVTGADKPSGSGGSDAASRVQNASGLIDSETDFTGVLTTYTWDSTRRLPLATTQAAGRPEALSTSTQWHPTLRLPVKQTEPGKTTDISYDARGNALSQLDTDTTGGASNGQTRTWAWTYTASNLVATHTDPLGHVWSYAYNAQGQRTSATNPLGQTTSYSYDSAGRLSSQTEPGANGSHLVTSTTYDPRGRITSISAAGETTRYSYTASGQVESATLPNGYSVSYQYDAAQRLIASTDNRGNRVSTTLDGMGNRVSEQISDATGTIAYATSRVINSLNRVSSITSGQGGNQGTTQYSFDANGEATSQTDPLNHTTRQTLDALRRPTAATLPDNSSTQTAWSALGDITSAQDPKGITTRYTRNAWGEVLSETSPDSGTQTTTRDAAGFIASQTDALGKTTTYTRNALGQVTGITLHDGSTQTLAYNAAGHLVQMTDASGNTAYTRDSLGRILQKVQTVNDNPSAPAVTTTSYTYHPGGQVASIRYPSGLTVNYRLGTGTQVGQTTQVDVQEPGKNQPVLPFVTNLTYTALAQPKSWNWNCLTGSGTGAASAANCDSASRSFDASGRMTANEFASYSYDAAGRITGITQNLWALQAAEPEVPATATTPAVPAVPASYYQVPLNWTAGYDNRDRITSFTRAGASTQYSYDANSNRLSSTDTTTSDTDLDGDFDAADLQRTTAQTQSIANDSNRLLGWSQLNTTKKLNTRGQPVTSSTSTQVNYGLDAAGNLTSDGLRTFSYDASNRLTQVQVGDDDEASKVTYLHNAIGQRVFKSEPQVAQTVPTEEQLGTDFITWLKKNFGWLFAQAQQNATPGQSYVYADSNFGSYNLLGEYGNGGSKSAGRLEYIYLPTETGTAKGNAILIGLYKNNRFYAVHTDHLGTPRSITDDTNKVVWQWAYSAFGDNKPTGILKATTNPKAAITNSPKLLTATNPSFAVNLRFPGQYWDDESKLSYNYFRSYRPAQGRYDQADPIGLEGGWSRFGYVGGNALWAIDPEGLQPPNAWRTIFGGRYPPTSIPQVDYVQVGVTAPIWGASLTLDRNLNVYFGVNTGCVACSPSPQFCAGRISGTPMSGDELSDFISGAGGQASAGQFGVGYGWAFSGGRSASQITVGGPQLPGGGSAGYSWKVISGVNR